MPAPPTTSVTAPHARPAAEALADLDVDPARGLAAAEASDRLRRFGENTLRQRRRRSVWRILANQLRSVIVWLLGGAAVLSFVFGGPAEGLAIVVVLIINTAIGFVTEWRAVRSMEALQRLAQVTATVRRDGEAVQVPAGELVPGDIVLLEGGDVVTADLRLIEAASLAIDESALTGESVPVAKSTAQVGRDCEIGDRVGMAFKGTAVTRGSGEGVVVATGMATELGAISALVDTAEPESSPLERRLDVLGGRLVWLTLALAAAIAAIGVLRGHELVAMVETAVALAVAAVPEGLPVVATLTLARGMLRMARRNALIERLSAVETLGATTVILTDKTGTLTENRMAAARYLLADQDIEVAGEGAAFPCSAEALSPELRAALEIGALCANAQETQVGAAVGDPMEVALLRVARRAGLARSGLLAARPELREHAFDPDLKLMATVHRDGAGVVVAVKGAPEAVIERSTQVLARGGSRRLDGRGRAVWVRRAEKAAHRGYRVLGLARRHAESIDADPYSGLTLVGLVCLLDPVRGDVPAAVDACLKAGVRVVVVTGDHIETAKEIAVRTGLGNHEDIVALTGAELGEVGEAHRDEARRARLLRTGVFARVAPKTKLDLVTLFQKAGEIVAMTGDGVNDAPALKKADIGIAMGLRGTQVAREAADMVLKDDAFTSIVQAMREGRVIFDNLRKFVVYLMSCNLSEILVVGLATLTGMPLPLLPLQILYLNLVTDVFPAMALGMGEGTDHVMRRPPRRPGEPILDRGRWLAIAGFGLLITAATLGSFAIALRFLELPPAEAVTAAFTTLALAQVWHVFNMRSARDGGWRNEITANRWMWGALALCVALVAAALFLPGLSDILGLPHAGWSGLGMAFAMSLAPLAVGQAWLLVAGRRARPVPPAS